MPGKFPDCFEFFHNALVQPTSWVGGRGCVRSRLHSNPGCNPGLFLFNPLRGLSMDVGAFQPRMRSGAIVVQPTSWVFIGRQKKSCSKPGKRIRAGYVQEESLLRFHLSDGGDHFGQHGFEIPDDAVIGHIEDGCILVVVDGHNVF